MEVLVQRKEGQISLNFTDVMDKCFVSLLQFVSYLNKAFTLLPARNFLWSQDGLEAGPVTQNPEIDMGLFVDTGTSFTRANLIASEEHLQSWA